MAPSKKKKAAHSDFAKTKSSIKAKQRAPASNATNTAFKAKSIVLPNQGNVTQIEERKATKLTDERGRGVQELITILRGVGQGGSKSEALDSLGGLLLCMPDGITVGLGLLPILLPQLTSNSASTRASLHSFLAKFLLAVPKDALLPYATTMTLWITSGMNHIWKEVREDAARVGQLVIDLLGQHLVQGWDLAASTAPAHTGPSGSTSASAGQAADDNNGKRFFDTLITALGIEIAGPSTSKSGSMVNVQSDLSSSPITKLRLLSCLEKLLRFQAGLGAQEAGVEDEGAVGKDEFPTWIFRSCFNAPSEWESFAPRRAASTSSANSYGTTAPTISITGSASLKEIAPFTPQFAMIEQQDGRCADFADVDASAGLVFTDTDLTRAIATTHSLMDESEAPGHAQDHRASSVDPHLQLYASLHSLLLHTFLDHAPSVLGPDASLSAHSEEVSLGLKLIDVVFSLARTCLRGALRAKSGSLSAETSTSPASNLKGADKEALQRLNALLDHSAIYFPFERDLKGAESYNKVSLLKRLSAGWCELVGISRMIGGGAKAGDAAQNRRRGGKSAGKSALHLESVEGYLVGLFSVSDRASEAARVVIDGSQSSTSHLHLSDGEYVALLPTVWYLLSASDGPTRGSEDSSQTRTDLLSKVIEHWATSPVKAKNATSSRIKALGFEFISRICLLSSYPSVQLDLRQYLTQSKSPARIVLRDEFIIKGLGRYIYELGSSLCASNSRGGKPAAATKNAAQADLHAAWLLLLHFAQLGLGGAGGGSVLGEEEVLTQLLPTLKPFFWIQHATRGDLPGPCRRLFQAGDKGVEPVRATVEAFVAYVAGARERRVGKETVKELLECVQKAQVVVRSI